MVEHYHIGYQYCIDNKKHDNLLVWNTPTIGYLGGFQYLQFQIMCYNILFIFYISNHFFGGEFPRYKIAEPNSKAFF